MTPSEKLDEILNDELLKEVHGLIALIKKLNEQSKNLQCCGNCRHCYLAAEFCIKCKFKPGSATPRDRWCEQWEFDGMTQKDRNSI